MQCGAGVEINLTSDCIFEVNLDQIDLLHKICEDLLYYYEFRFVYILFEFIIYRCNTNFENQSLYYSLRSEYYDYELELCPYAEILKHRATSAVSPNSSQVILPEGK